MHTRLLALGGLFALSMHAATFGTVTQVIGGLTDLVLDEPRARLYLVDTTQNRIDVYSTAQRRFLNPIPVAAQPLSAALARTGKYLYVTSYQGASLEIVDLDAAVVVNRVSLPAAPEGVAVGGDGRVLISTLGSGTNNAENRLLLYDPNSVQEDGLRVVPTTLPAPTVPVTPAPSSRVFMSTRSNLTASADGRWIIGLNNPSTTSRQLFVFEVASGTVLRSRTLTSISNVLSVSANGEKFMAGLSLFDTSTLAILAQQNTANALYPFATTANFNTQQNQGGSVFAPDGTTVYSAFNIAPVQSTSANTTQFMLSDSDNLLIRLGIQLPENLTGNMVIDSAGRVIYALSQSGFLTVPISTVYDSPIAAPDSPAVLLVNDQCGVNADRRVVEVTTRNAGKGRMTATAQVLQTGTAVTVVQPIGGQPGTGGGAPGAGGGAPGGGFPITLPGGGQVTIPPTTGQTITTTQQTAITQSAPTLRTRRTDTETIFEFTFNSNAARSLGTQTPTEFLVQSTEAINIPARIRVYQNHRNAEATGDVRAVPVSISTAEGLVDIVADPLRPRIYIANSGLNRVEVFDTNAKEFLAPIKVGQLPRSLAIAPGGRLMYVANTGGESISVIDLEAGAVTGRVKFPAVPYNASFALNTPSVIAATLAGVQIVMSDGTLWKVVDNEALPRRTSAVIGTAAVTAPRTMAAAPGGEYAVLLGGGGTAYLFDALADEYVLSQTVSSTPIQGYFGPVAAGPRGQYYVINGTLLNSTLTPVSSTAVTGARPTAAVAAVSATLFARFSQPVRANANAVVTETPTVDLLDATTTQARGSSAVMEGPLATQAGTQRSNVSGRTMAVDAAGTTAYVLTTSGLSIVPLVTTPAGPPGQPGGQPSAAVTVSSGGIVNTASYTATIAPGSVISIFGQNLGTSAVSSVPLQRLLGGTCVTLDDVPLPLFMTSAGQINAQIPPATTTGSHSLVVRSVDRHLAGARISLNVQKYAPAVFLNPETQQAAVYRPDGRPVTKSAKAKRDEPLVLYAIGLGATTGGTVTAGSPSPSSPLAATETPELFFGDPRMAQSEIIVDWSGLAPGLIGVYQINLRVPGFHEKGDNLPVTLRIGGVSSPATGPAAPTIAVE